MLFKLHPNFYTLIISYQSCSRQVNDMSYQSCSKQVDDQEIDFSIEAVVPNPRTPSYSPAIIKNPKTPTYSPSSYEDFEPFLNSTEDPWKVKASFGTKTILVRENYNRKIEEKHLMMAKAGKKRKLSQIANEPPKNEKKNQQSQKKSELKNEKPDDTRIRKRVNKLRRKLKFSKRLNAYKLKKTLQKRPSIGNVFKNNILPYLAVMELQNRLLLAEIEDINVRLRNISLSSI